MTCELYNDNFQNYKVYGIPKAQLVIADMPYQLGRNAYGFEVDKGFYKAAKEKMLVNMTQDLFTIQAIADKDAEREERKRMYALDI